MSNENPLCEVFGFPITNTGKKAAQFRKSRLCPYHNISANCTKDKAQNPLGVCSIFNGINLAITCPVRLRQDWLIASDTAEYFFEPGTSWTSLSEIRLNDANGKSAGNIDLVLVSYDREGNLLDFGAVEVQAVYISGNVRQPFEKYMETMSPDFTWSTGYNYPKADYLSSSRKRLIPQLIFKGGILNAWNKKTGVILHESFYNTLPELPEVHKDESNVAWFIYGLDYNKSEQVYSLAKRKVVYTQFGEALQKISTPIPGSLENFVKLLQKKLDEKFENNNPPETENPASMLRFLNNEEDS
jgi:hypothetical protein